MPIFKGSLSTPIEEYVWKWPDPTASELRRFIERDVGRYFVNAMRDVGVTLGFMTFVSGCPPVLSWLSRAEELVAIPEEVEEQFLRVDGARAIASCRFPSLSRTQLDAVKIDIINAMTWLRTEFPAAGVECLPDDFWR